MYIYGEIVIPRPNVQTLPQQAILAEGNHSYCFLVVDDGLNEAYNKGTKTFLSFKSQIRLVTQK